MKKIFVLILLVGFSFTVHSQSNEDSDVVIHKSPKSTNAFKYPAILMIGTSMTSPIISQHFIEFNYQPKNKDYFFAGYFGFANKVLLSVPSTLFFNFSNVDGKTYRSSIGFYNNCYPEENSSFAAGYFIGLEYRYSNAFRHPELNYRYAESSANSSDPNVFDTLSEIQHKVSLMFGAWIKYDLIKNRIALMLEFGSGINFRSVTSYKYHVAGNMGSINSPSPQIQKYPMINLNFGFSVFYCFSFRKK